MCIVLIDNRRKDTDKDKELHLVDDEAKWREKDKNFDEIFNFFEVEHLQSEGLEEFPNQEKDSEYYHSNH